MGEAYLGWHPFMNCQHAVKRILLNLAGNADVVERFAREFRALSQLNHANVVRIYNAGPVDESFYYSMDYLPGGDLENRVPEGGLPISTARDYICQVAAGLRHAAESGIVHRDIKPSNLLLGRNGQTVCIADFGICRNATERTLTQRGQRMGTPLYMAPEQEMGTDDIDSRADIYSLGATLFYLLARQPPYKHGYLLERLARPVGVLAPDILAVRPDVPKWLADAIVRMMAESPDKRYATLDAVIGVLQPGHTTSNMVDPVLAYENGYNHYHGKHAPANREDAFTWFHIAAGRGHVEAQYFLGLMYADATCSHFNYAAAVEWFNKAASTGYDAAQNAIGFMYEMGRGVPADPERAVHFYRLAAEQNFHRAEFNLARCYETAIGTPRNLSAARRYYESAAAGGNVDATQWLRNNRVRR